MDIEAWRSLGSTIQIGNHNIFYVDSKPTDAVKGTVLLLHGFPTSSWDWAKIFEGLSNDYRIVAPDFLGFGFSDKPADVEFEYSIMKQADIVEGLISHLSLEEFHVLSHDYGDTVAQELLARQQDNTGVGKWLSVCLLNGGLFPETHRPLFIQELLLGPYGSWVSFFTFKYIFCANLTATFGPLTPPSEKEKDTFWDVMCHNNGTAIFHKLITYMTDRVTHRERWVGALKECTFPIGLINGSCDSISGKHMVKRYLELNDTPQLLVELPSIGHYPQVESPGEVLMHYLEFLEPGQPSGEPIGQFEK